MTDLDLQIRNLRSLSRSLEEENPGLELYLVGGAVRDMLQGAMPKDLDVLARGLPEELLVLALESRGNLERVGSAFPVFLWRPDGWGQTIEVAMPRKERSLFPGHTKGWEVEVSHELPVESDLERRDFTVNAMAYRVSQTGEIIDPFDGREDLTNERVRSLTSQSFQDDPLRILRALRLISERGMGLDLDTRDQAAAAAPLLRTISAERVRDELSRILLGKSAGTALFLMANLGVLEVILPEVAAGVGCEQNMYHTHDVYGHVVRVVDNIPATLEGRLAALLHDVAKPLVKWIGDDGVAHFYHPEDDQEFITPPLMPGDHEIVGASVARAILTRLKYPNEVVDRVSCLVENHMFPQGPKVGARVARRVLRRMDEMPGDTRENLDLLFALRKADSSGGKSELSTRDAQDNARVHKLAIEALEACTALSAKDLALDGHALMSLGLVGPDIGHAQRALLDYVLDHPEANTAEDLEQRLVEIGVV